MLGPQPLGPLFAVARADLVVPSGTWWRGTGAKMPRHQKRVGPGVLSSPATPSPRARGVQRRYTRLRDGFGARAGIRSGLGSLGERDCVCSAPRSTAGIGLCVCVCVIVVGFFMLLLFFFGKK